MRADGADERASAQSSIFLAYRELPIVPIALYILYIYRGTWSPSSPARS